MIDYRLCLSLIGVPDTVQIDDIDRDCGIWMKHGGDEKTVRRAEFQVLITLECRSPRINYLPGLNLRLQKNENKNI